MRAENELLRAIQGLGISQRSGGLTPATPSDCVICQEPLDPAHGKMLVPCRHHFHAWCIREWFHHSRNSTRPNCRQHHDSPGKGLMSLPENRLLYLTRKPWKPPELSFGDQERSKLQLCYDFFSCVLFIVESVLGRVDDSLSL